MSLQGTTRTKPDVRLSRIRLPTFTVPQCQAKMPACRFRSRRLPL
jgi:hypothetical protein